MLLKHPAGQLLCRARDEAITAIYTHTNEASFPSTQSIPLPTELAEGYRSQK